MSDAPLILKPGMAMSAPSGQRVVGLDGNGVLVDMDSAGAKSRVGSGFSFAAQLLADFYRATDIDPTTFLDADDGSDLIHAFEYDISIGSTPAAFLATKSGGVLRGPSGAGTGYVYLAAQGVAAPPVTRPTILNPRVENWLVGSILTFPTTLTGAHNVWVARMDDATSTIALKYEGATSTTALQLICDGTGLTPAGVKQQVSCVGAGIIGTDVITGAQANKCRYVLAYIAATGTLYGIINGVLGASFVCAAANVSALPSTPSVLAGSVASLYDLDALYVAWKRPQQ